MKAAFFLLAAIFVTSITFAQAPRIPATGASYAFDEWNQLSTDRQLFTRYIWCPNGDAKEHVVSSLIINFGINHSDTEWILGEDKLSAQGALVRVDFLQLADTIEEAQRLVALWDSLAKQDFYFFANVQFVKVPCDPYRASDGKTYDYKFEGGSCKVANHIHVACPIGLVYRVDWLIGKTLGSINGGKYLEFRGLIPGKTKLDDYLLDRGVSLEPTSADRAGLMRKVNRKPGAIELRYSKNVRPTTSLPLACITEDIADGQIDPASDSFLSFVRLKKKFHETFVPTPSGYLEGFVWDDNNVLQATAPENVVVDWEIPNPHTKQLHGILSCIRCHGPSSMWIPYRNEVRDQLAHTTLLAEASKSLDTKQQFEDFRILAVTYAAQQYEIDGRLQDARDSLNRRIFSSCGGVNAKQALLWLIEMYNQYEYADVTAELALQEVGIAIENDPEGKLPPGVYTFRKVIQPLADNAIIAEGPAGYYNRLRSVYPEVTMFIVDGKEVHTQELRGYSITRRQMESIFHDLMFRVLPILAQAKPEEP